MDRLIKDIEKIISEYRVSKDCLSTLSLKSYLFSCGRNEVVNSLSLALDLYEVRQSSQCSKSKEISSEQWRQIDNLVDDAGVLCKLLPDDISFDNLSGQDAYRHGFVTAVLRMCSILGIDENFVKK